MQVLHAAKVDQRGRQEAAQADVEDETALDDLDDFAFDVLAAVELLFDLRPGALVLRALLGQDEPAVLVFLLQDECLDVVTHGDDLGGVDVLADGELAGGDDALGLVADVEQDLVPLHAHDRAVYEVALVERIDRAVDEGMHLLIGVLGLLDDAFVGLVGLFGR